MEAKFFKFLKIVGVGFKARVILESSRMVLKLGYSHDVEVRIPPCVRAFCFKPNVICICGIDRQKVHDFAGALRNLKKPDPYKGKGISYLDEVIKLKKGKKSK